MIDLNILYAFVIISPKLFIPLWKQCKLFKPFVYTNRNKIISMNLNNCNYYVFGKRVTYLKFFFKLFFSIILCLSLSLSLSLPLSATVFLYTIAISFAYLPYTYKEWTEVESSHSFIYSFHTSASLLSPCGLQYCVTIVLRCTVANGLCCLQMENIFSYYRIVQWVWLLL